MIKMSSCVVMEKAEGVEPEEGKSIRAQLEHIMEKMKHGKGYKGDASCLKKVQKRKVVRIAILPLRQSLKF